MIERCLFTLSGLVLLAGAGAFLLYVPLFSIFAAAMLLLGMILMFGAGVYVGAARASSEAGERSSEIFREPVLLMTAGSHGD